MGIGGVLGDRQVGGVAEDLVQDVVRLAFRGNDNLGAVGGVLVGDVRVRREPLVREVATRSSCRDGLSTRREA